MADPASNIPVDDMLAEFNRWLEQRNHKTWNAKTLATRLGGNEITHEHGVVNDRTSDRSGVSRPPVGYDPDKFGHSQPLARQYRAWIGVRFRASNDDV